MRRPTSPVAALVAVGLLALGPLAACSDDGGRDEAGPTTTTTADRGDGSSTSTTADADLATRVLDPGELPPGFARDDTGIDHTITSFCVGQDAAAGLQASARLAAGFRRQPAGAAVVQLVFRFRDGDAERFVTQARGVLDACSEVPDLQGLAFTYEDSTPAVDAVLDGSDAHVSRFGASVGSAALTEVVAVFRNGDVGQLIAVLGRDLPRAELDALAASAFRAATARARAS